jgi:hypothetical protein
MHLPFVIGGWQTANWELCAVGASPHCLRHRHRRATECLSNGLEPSAPPYDGTAGVAVSAAKLVGMDRSSGDWNWGVRNDGELHEKA